MQELGVIPVAVIDDSSNALQLADALAAGGLPCVEVTFRTAAAESSIKAISQNRPDILVGAGTVITVEQAEKAIGAGARFVVAPGFDPEVVDYCLSQGVEVFPGCATASEITQAYRRGLRVVKFFPCGQLGGLATIKALSGPFGGMKFIPTGGINMNNLQEYLNSPLVLACGGSWLANAKLINDGCFDEILQNARNASEAVRLSRG
jgi:2-dehydro-3-deoxyphosphogluconate aldolase/(4S)-4-hydroxy-2-oxoglutarate aldolase